MRLQAPQKGSDLALGQKHDRQRLVAGGERRVAFETKRPHRFRIAVHAHFLHLNVRELRKDLIERQTCRFAAASEVRIEVGNGGHLGSYFEVRERVVSIQDGCHLGEGRE